MIWNKNHDKNVIDIGQEAQLEQEVNNVELDKPHSITAWNVENKCAKLWHNRVNYLHYHGSLHLSRNKRVRGLPPIHPLQGV